MSIPNTKKHIKDNAEYVTVSSGGNIPDSAKNVQEVLESIGSYAYSNPGLPRATTSVEGISRIATDAEVIDGIGTNTIVTPAALNKRLEHPEATTTQLGLTQYATNAEALAGALNNRTIVASSLKYVLDKTSATESRAGLAKISTNIQAQAGTDDTTIMTPKKVAHAIKMLSPAEGIATEKSTGVVILATTAQAQNGQTREGMAISPYTFVNSKATTTKVGTVRCSTITEAVAGAITDGVAITPSVFKGTRATTNQIGTTQLASVSEAEAAMIATKAVTPAGLNFIKSNISNIETKLKTKITGGNIVQTTGSSTSDVMSQDSVSKAINSIKNTALLKESGYWKDSSSGLIIQWGTVRCGDNQCITYDFPIPFQSTAFSFVVSPLSAKVQHGDYMSSAHGLVNSKYRYTVCVTSNDNYNGITFVSWIAIGI